MFKKIRHFVGKRIHVLKTLYPEYQHLIKEIGSFDTFESQRKFKEMLIKQSHIIEKGLSLKDTRVGFGVPKIKKMLHDLSAYYEQFHDQETLYFILSIVEAYLKFNQERGENSTEIRDIYNNLMDLLPQDGIDASLCGGTISLSKDMIIQYSSMDFENFSKSRHSIRQFTGEAVSLDLIKKALAIAEYTPSACNRQPWRNYIFTQKGNITRILDAQTGARQFKNDISCLILVTATANAFGLSEYHQAYVNGGLYAMNLLYALHACGLGTIPLNMGISEKQKVNIQRICNIPPSDTPILLIGVGQMPNHLIVAKSCRFPYSNYCIFDQK